MNEITVYKKLSHDILAVCESLFGKIVHVYITSTNIGLKERQFLSYCQGVGSNGHIQH